MLFNGKTDKIMLHAMNSFSAASEPSVTSRMFMKGIASILKVMLKTQIRILFQVSPHGRGLSAIVRSFPKITVLSVLGENCRVHLPVGDTCTDSFGMLFHGEFNCEAHIYPSAARPDPQRCSTTWAASQIWVRFLTRVTKKHWPAVGRLLARSNAIAC